MTTPAYSHTYTYARVGVGDVIALDPAGEPHTALVSTPAGWTANYWYSTNALASIQDVGEWTQLALGGFVPPGARKIAVNVLSTPGRAPESARLEVKMLSDSYKAATGHRNTDSGAHSTSFGTSLMTLDPPGAPLVFLDFTDPAGMFTDVAQLIPVSVDGDDVNSIDDKGSWGGVLDTTTHGNAPRYTTNLLNGFSGMQFDVSNTEALISVAAHPNWSGNANQIWLGIGVRHPGSPASTGIIWYPNNNFLGQLRTLSNEDSGSPRLDGPGQPNVEQFMTPNNATEDIGWAGWCVSDLVRSEVSLSGMVGSIGTNAGASAGDDPMSVGVTGGGIAFCDLQSVVQLIAYTGATLPSPAALEAYVTAKFGIVWL